MKLFEVEHRALSPEAGEIPGHPGLEGQGRNIFMHTPRSSAPVPTISGTVSCPPPLTTIALRCRCIHMRYPVFANKSAFSEVLNVTSIEEDLGSMPMGPGGLGTEITDEDFDDGDEDIASPRPPPSGIITPSESSIRSSDGALTATTVKRRVVRVSDASYATYRAMLYFLYTGLVLEPCA